MAGVFQVMAFGVRALDKNDIDASYIAKLAKIATAEIISSKVCIIFISWFFCFIRVNNMKVITSR